MTSEETAVPFPYPRLIVGKRHCRVLILGNINSDATGMMLSVDCLKNTDATGNDISGLPTLHIE